jgi:hypothetical protein
MTVVLGVVVLFLGRGLSCSFPKVTVGNSTTTTRRICSSRVLPSILDGHAA